jgi:putative aminopeptidase FrvX
LRFFSRISWKKSLGTINMPSIGNTQLKLLEKLTNACAVSGDEGEVRRIVLEELKGQTDDIRVDALGNVLAWRNGAGSKRLRVMLSAHMDEVGFMLVADDGSGLFRFELIGGIDVRHLPGKSVLVGKDHKPGVIGTRPPHLTTAEERKRKISLEELRIDVGPEGGSPVLGDRATFATRFQRNGSVLIAKALDDRMGVVNLIELVRNAPPNIDLLAAFTVQEENGLRGAKVAAYAFDPDLGVALDSTPAHDLPTWDGEENTSYNTRLGLGPAIYIGDGSTLSDPRLVRWLAKTAASTGIPFQYRQPGSGGTDAGAIHRARAGIPSVSVSVPHRYSHTAASIARLEDWKNAYALLHTALSNITPALLAGDRA